jgi:hypothetical protein
VVSINSTPHDRYAIIPEGVILLLSSPFSSSSLPPALPAQATARLRDAKRAITGDGWAEGEYYIESGRFDSNEQLLTPKVSNRPICFLPVLNLLFVESEASAGLLQEKLVSFSI